MGHCNLAEAAALSHKQTTAALPAGAERLKAWHGREPDAFSLWGLHDSACRELAEAAAECVGALDAFGAELSGAAAAKAGNQLETGAFNSIADYLKNKVRGSTLRSRSACATCSPIIPCSVLLAWF